MTGASLVDVLPWGVLEPLFLLGPLGLVPIGLDVADRGTPPRGVRLAVRIGSLAATAALASRVGPVAGALALVWLAVTMRLALHGGLRLASRRMRDAAETAIDLGLLALPVGGAWFVASRLGIEPMGFREPIVLLTAIHFHFAAFGALVWTGSAARRLAPSWRRTLAVTGVAAGTPLVAAGTTFTPWLELVGALVLAGSLGALAVAVLRRVRPADPVARVLVRVSAASVLFSLALAVAYAWGQAVTPVVSLATMAHTHGVANALGFGLCGLAGWARISRGADAS
jgi:hypothetical protein